MSCKIETIKSSLDELLVETLKSLGSNMKSKSNIEKAVGIISNVAGSPVVNSWANGVLNGLADKDVINGMKIVANDVEFYKDVNTKKKNTKQIGTTDGAINVWSTKDGVNEHRLSNMIAGPINAKGKVFATIENLFQYSKAKFAGDEESAAEILAANNGFEAKRLGGKVANLNRKEWDKVARQKLKQSMKLYYKQNKDGRDLLLSTDGKEITHNSQYKDDRWTKEFPELLVEIRNELSGSQKVETGTNGGREISENGSKSFADKIKIANKGLAADKHTWKEVVKANLSTQYIGFGKKGSSTDRYVSVYGDKANTGKYTADDVIYVSSNGARSGRVNPVVDGKLSNGYELIDKAIEAGSTIVMDSEEHIKNTGIYNIGEVALAEYMDSHGYSRRNIKGAGIWTKDVVKAIKKDEKLPSVVLSKSELAKYKSYNDKVKKDNPNMFKIGSEFSYDPVTNVITVMEVDENVTAEQVEVYTMHEIKHAKTYEWIKNNEDSKEFKYLSKALRKANNEFKPTTDKGQLLLRDRLTYAHEQNSDLGRVAELVAILASEPNIRESFKAVFPQESIGMIEKILEIIKDFMSVGTRYVLETVDLIDSLGDIGPIVDLNKEAAKIKKMNVYYTNMVKPKVMDVESISSDDNSVTIKFVNGGSYTFRNHQYDVKKIEYISDPTENGKTVRVDLRPILKLIDKSHVRNAALSNLSTQEIATLKTMYRSVSVGPQNLMDKSAIIASKGVSETFISNEMAKLIEEIKNCSK